MRLHDAFKMAAERVEVTLGGPAGAADGDRRLEPAMTVGRLQRPDK